MNKIEQLMAENAPRITQENYEHRTASAPVSIPEDGIAPLKTESQTTDIRPGVRSGRGWFQGSDLHFANPVRPRNTKHSIGARPRWRLSTSGKVFPPLATMTGRRARMERPRSTLSAHRSTYI